MKKEFRDLFYSEKYEDIVKDTKLLINNKPNDAELWYCLFLAENTNYIDIDFENINNEICFNKAIQLANKRQREEFNSEYNLYRDLSKYPNIRKIVRYAEFGSYERVIDLFALMDDDRIELPEENDIYSNIDYCFCNSSSPAVIDCSLLVVNLLYIKTGKEEYLKILEDLISNAAECESALNPYSLSNDFDSLLKKVDLLEKLYDTGEEKDSIGRLLAKIEINLADGNFDVAEELINDILEQDNKCAKAYWYLVFIKRQAKTYEELTSKFFDIEENSYFKKAMDLADSEFKQFLEDVIDTFAYQESYEEALFKMKENPLDALKDFKILQDYKNSKELVETCKELVYQKALTLSPSGAITYLSEITEYKDSKQLIEKFRKEAKTYEAERKKREKKEKIAKGFSNFFGAIGDFFVGIGDWFYYNDETIFKVFNIILSLLSFGYIGYYFVAMSLDLPSPFDFIPLIIYNGVLLLSSFFVPKEGKPFYKLPVSLVYILMLAVGWFGPMQLMIVGGAALIFVIVTSIRQRKFNGTIFFAALLSLIGSFVKYSIGDLGDGSGFDIVSLDMTLVLGLPILILAFRSVGKFKKIKLPSVSRGSKSSSSRSYNSGGGKVSNVIISVINIFMIIYFTTMKSEAFLSDSKATIMMGYCGLIVLFAFFLPRRNNAFYKYTFAGMFLSLGYNGVLVYEEMMLVWVVTGGLLVLITSMRQKEFNGTVFFSLLFGMILSYINYVGAYGFTFIPFAGVAILALVVGRQYDPELSQHVSNVCAVGILVLFINALFSDYYANPIYGNA